MLAATGLFLYLRLGAELDRSIDNGLRSRADEVTALVRQSDSGLREGRSRLAERSESFAQILDAGGRVIDSTAQVRARPLLDSSDLTRATRRTVLLDHRSVPGRPEDQARLLATPVRAQDQRLIVVVGTSLEDRDDAVENLGALLLIGGPVALLLASAAGYLAISASLQPVERMRRRAREISAGRRDQRLPVPPARDEIGRLGETLNDMLARLEEAFNRERTFVSDASHELRTPLTVLKGEIELALRRGRSAEELQAALRSVGEETDRLAQLAEDLLVIASSDQGKLPVRPAPVPVSEIFTDVKNRFAIRSREMKRAVTSSPTGDLSVYADPLRLRQALANMVDNALRHGQGPIRLSAHEADARVELHVTDEGPGFAPAFLAAAFERFSRAPHDGTPGGTGLGLAIVQAIAEAHGGKASAGNRPGGGADVWISLPSNVR